MSKILHIDGENFKKKIFYVFKESGKELPLWHNYDFKGLFDQVLKGVEIDRTVFYFGKLTVHPETPVKSRELIEAQRLLKLHLEKSGFEVVLSGRVRGQEQIAPWFKGGKRFVFNEKGVDVKIAVDIVVGVCDKNVELVILGSSDSDLQPAILEVKRRDVPSIYLGFESSPNKGLTYTTDRTILIRNSEVLEFGGVNTGKPAKDESETKTDVVEA